MLKEQQETLWVKGSKLEESLTGSRGQIRWGPWSSIIVRSFFSVKRVAIETFRQRTDLI